MSKRLAVIGVGNMAKSIISGIKKSNIDVEHIYLYDINPNQYSAIVADNILPTNTINEAVTNSDYVLLSVKPQNFPEILAEISNLPCASDKVYISIAAGITVEYISNYLNTNKIVRALPNIPMLISKGVSAVCYNDKISTENFDFVVDIFKSSGSVLKINEADMNKTIGVTSSSPAYVFKFIQAICDAATAQGLSDDGLISAVCDMIIGSAELIKRGYDSPRNMIKAVASKGGTTEKALEVLDKYNFESIIAEAMIACTNRADELGQIK